MPAPRTVRPVSENTDTNKPQVLLKNDFRDEQEGGGRGEEGGEAGTAGQLPGAERRAAGGGGGAANLRPPGAKRRD